MKNELNRVKSDVETIQKAMGLSPSLGRDWVQWMKRDNWLNLWWCLPGLILIVSGLLPADTSTRYFGLVVAQWTGLLVAGVMLGITVLYMRTMSGADGRPESLVREQKRVNGLTGHGAWLNFALGLGLVLFFVWAKQSHLSFQAFWSGLFIFMGSGCLLTAIASRTWLLLGWALPFLSYGLFETLIPGTGRLGGISLGMMFLGVALSFSLIQIWQIRQIESGHVPH